MQKWAMLPLFVLLALIIALPEWGLSAESPKIEKAALKRDFIGSDQRYNYLFDFDFVNTLPQPIEIVSVNVFDVRGQRVAQDWAISGPNFDPRILTHELSGNHPLVKMFSKPGRGTPLEQATVSSVGGRMEIKVTNRVLSAGQAIRPSGYILASKNNYDSLILRVAYRVNGTLQEVSHTFTVGMREEAKSPSAPVPQPVPTPTPPPSLAKKVTSIEEVDFANFTFTLSAPEDDCAGLKRKTVPLRKGAFKESGEFGVEVGLGKVVYTDVTGDKMNEAVVPLNCDPHGNYIDTVSLVYTLRDGEPVLIGSFGVSNTGRDYKKYYPSGFFFSIGAASVINGKVIIHRAADGSHACPENDVRFEYAWKGNSFVLAGKPVKTPLKNCGAVEKPSSAPVVGKAGDTPLKCQGAPFVFPVNSGYIGWLYKESTEGKIWDVNDPKKLNWIDGKEWIDPSEYHSGLDFWVAQGTPVIAQATGYVSRSPGWSAKEQSYNVNIYYPSLGVETYTNNLVNLQVTYDPKKKQGTAVSAGTVIGYAGSYSGHIHWSVGPKDYNDQAKIPLPTFDAIQRDPTPFLTPNGKSLNARGEKIWNAETLSWWCIGGQRK
jgi:hypothetical protein